MANEFTYYTKLKTEKAPLRNLERLFSDPAGTRTQDPNIKSVMLYQLSYEIILYRFRLKWCKYRIIELCAQALF